MTPLKPPPPQDSPAVGGTGAGAETMDPGAPAFFGLVCAFRHGIDPLYASDYMAHQFQPSRAGRGAAGGICYSLHCVPTPLPIRLHFPPWVIYTQVEGPRNFAIEELLCRAIHRQAVGILQTAPGDRREGMNWTPTEQQHDAAQGAHTFPESFFG